MVLNIGMVNPPIPNKMRPLSEANSIIYYKGFLLIEQHNRSWLIRPENSPLLLLPFRTDICSLVEAKQLLDTRLSKKSTIPEAA